MDVFILNFITYILYDKEYLYFGLYITLFWLFESYFFGFYNVYRYTRPLRLLSILVKQFLIFILGYFAYFGVFREGIAVHNQFSILIFIIL